MLTDGAGWLNAKVKRPPAIREISQIPLSLSSVRFTLKIKIVSVSVRFTEKGNLEVLLFTIQSKMRANNQKVYIPRDGKLISDINKVRSIAL